MTTDGRIGQARHRFLAALVCAALTLAMWRTPPIHHHQLTPGDPAAFDSLAGAPPSSALPPDLAATVIRVLQRHGDPGYAISSLKDDDAMADIVAGSQTAAHGPRFHAANPAQSFERTFSEKAIRVGMDSPQLNASVFWELELTAFGWTGTPQKVGAGGLVATGSRLEAGRSTAGRLDLVEWYENGPLGLEHGFTIPAPPAEPPGRAGSAGGELTLEFAIGGDWTVVSGDDSRSLEFHHRSGASLRYGHLYAWDARGRQLPARLASDRGRLALLVDRVGAEYPITIDPLLQRQKLTASDGAIGEAFGISIAMSGDTALVGAMRADVGTNADQGSAYVFVRNGANWIEQAKLTASDGAAGDQLGYSVAIIGDTALVGALMDDVDGKVDQGSAYVFVRSGSTWTQQAKLLAGDGTAFDLFGVGVGLGGDTAVVGAVREHAGYVFVRSGSIWTPQAKLTTNPEFILDSVALSGETALLGSALDNVGLNDNQRSVYVFVRSGGIWTEQARLTASDGEANHFFGWRVALSGDTALVGAVFDDVGGNANQGSAYLSTCGQHLDPADEPHGQRR
jgi:hypothetical protein